MKILFLNLSGLKFNVTTPLTDPLGGTESAVCYLATELAKLGHDVTLMANTEEAVHENVKHMPVSEETVVPLDPDVVVVPSAPQAFAHLQKVLPRAKLVLWNHMMPDQPAIQPLFHPDVSKTIPNIVFVSENQKAFFRVNGHVINNAVAPVFENMFASADEILAQKECVGTYASTPFRGLAILADVKEVQIKVFSSMQVYQSDDLPFAEMYKNLEKNDCLTMMGSVSQTQLAQEFKKASFFVYPCIFRECNSIAVVEAMAAGMKVITTDYAHPATEFVTSMAADTGTVEEFTKLLRQNVNSFRSQPEKWAMQMYKQVQYINDNYTWKKRALEWQDYLLSLVR